MLDDSTQLAVIRGLREGRRDAWTTLYDAYAVDIWRYVGHLIGGTSSEIGDVVQETFLAAARSGASVILTSHVLSELEELVDDVLVKVWKSAARKHGQGLGTSW